MSKFFLKIGKGTFAFLNFIFPVLNIEKSQLSLVISQKLSEPKMKFLKVDGIIPDENFIIEHLDLIKGRDYFVEVFYKKRSWHECFLVKMYEQGLISLLDIVQRQQVSEEFIERYGNILISFSMLPLHQTLSEEFIDKYADRISWKYIGEKHHQLSEAFMDKHSTRLNWEIVSPYQYFGDDFFEKHWDKLNLRTSSANKKLSPYIREKCIERYYVVFEHPNFTLSIPRDMTGKGLQRVLERAGFPHIMKQK